ncbi:hypothetical protein T492DRAFT_566830, partial [Pavlovales sp. CCMP2436]
GSAPSDRMGHSLIPLGNRLVVFGGLPFGPAGSHEWLGDLWRLRCDLAATGIASWELIAPTSEHTPVARMVATLSPVSLSDSAHPVGLFLFGGGDGECLLNDVWLFDTRTAAVRTHRWTRHECAGASPSPRYLHAACRVAESMYIFGGSAAEVLLNDLWEYALNARAWTQMVSTGGSAPSPRRGHSLVPLSNRLVVFGGCDNATNSNDSGLHCFDLQRRRWS